MVEHALTRRSFLTKTTTAAAGIATGVAVGNAIFRIIPDEELIKLGSELESAWATERVIYAATTTEGDVPPDHERERNAASAVTGAVVDRIGKLRATTLAGFCVKAKAVHWCHAGETLDDECISERGTVDARIAASVLRDLLALPHL